MNKRNLLLILLTGLIVLSVFVFQGCPNKLSGNPNEQKAPSIYWADVTIDTSYSSNPSLRWFSTDQDGLVIDYQYCVMFDTTVARLGGAAALSENFPADAQWSVVHKDSATIQLYSSADTSVYVPQYVFLRAMDDDSLYSEIIYKYMRRNNHAPTCYLILPFHDMNGNGTYQPGEPPEPQWCLPETTTAWKGIRAAWVGKDSIDIKGLQPDFDWNVKLYGPFPDSASCDTMIGNLYREFINPSNGSVWIRDKEKYLVNLETGWYMLSVRNRDDAFVSSIPATGRLVIYEPTWVRHPELTKSILLASHTAWALRTNTFRRGDLRDTYMDTVKQFYSSLIENAGYSTADYDWVDYTITDSTSQHNTFELVPPKSDLYNHKLVIIVDTNQWKSLTSDQQKALNQYIDVGGMLWIIGRRSFETSSDANLRQYGSTDAINPMPYKYLDLSASYATTPTNWANCEFIGAIALQSGFPDLQVDTTRTVQGDWKRYVNPDTIYYHYIGIPSVNYLVRGYNSETIYKYVSLSPDTSVFHNFPVAIRYNQGSFKTAYFCFPLYFIQYDQAALVTSRMLEWFFQDN